MVEIIFRLLKSAHYRKKGRMLIFRKLRIGAYLQGPPEWKCF
jgi:hypothetical protein